MKSNNYVVIQGWMCNELELKGNELLVFALLHGFCQDEESSFSGSRSYIADTFNISLPTVDKALEGLKNKDLIQVDKKKDNSCTYKVSFQGVRKFLSKGCKETFYNNIDNNTIRKQTISKDIVCRGNFTFGKSTKKEDTQEGEMVTGFKTLYNTHCTNLPKVSKLTDKRIKAIKDILKKYTTEEIIQVLDIANSSDFLTGNNDRGWKADIDFILREDKFISILEGKYSTNKKGKFYKEGKSIPVTKEEVDKNIEEALHEGRKIIF